MATSKPSSPDAVLLPSDAAASDTIIVKVGSEGKKYTLHTELLKHHSGYFRGALSGTSKETDDGIIPLLDVDIDAFNVFVNWIYRGVLAALIEYVWIPDENAKRVAFRSYVLADRLIVPGLKSALLNSCVVVFRNAGVPIFPSVAVIVHLFENLTEHDPLLRLCVDVWCINKMVYHLDGDDKAQVSELPQKFLVRLLLRMNEVGQEPQTRSSLKCEHYKEVTRVDG